MKTEVVLAITASSARTSGALGSVLAPDNEGNPKGLRFSSQRRGRSTVFRATSESPSTALSTAVSILRDVSLFQEVWLLSGGGAPLSQKRLDRH
ncbi:MAG: hypothetical protein HY297_00680 [Thaumarchaeota archaeon]|nr:hypothetical protein [Nitrososphaerota archaeon]